MQHHEETERLNEARRQNASQPQLIAKERRTAAGWDSTLLRINHESYLPLDLTPSSLCPALFAGRP